jgi:hypothetical protein
MWIVHILCKNLGMPHEQKLLIFLHEDPVIHQETFPQAVRPACKLEVGTVRLVYEIWTEAGKWTRYSWHVQASRVILLMWQLCNCNEASNKRQFVMSVMLGVTFGVRCYADAAELTLMDWSLPCLPPAVMLSPPAHFPNIFLQSSHSVHTIIGSHNLH